MRDLTAAQRVALDNLDVAVNNAIIAFQKPGDDRGMTSGWLAMAVTTVEDDDPDSLLRYRDDGHLFVPDGLSPTLMRGMLDSTLDRFRGA